LNVALRNLLTNAIKYTPVKGTIRISIDDQSLSITDSGPGIPEDKLAFVTDRFYRVPGNRETGSGLGLTIVSRAAEILNATLQLSNQPQGGLKATLYWKK
ncbi:MAG: ATP-binding protein, partial [Rickettsiales bacterium]